MGAGEAELGAGSWELGAELGEPLGGTLGEPRWAARSTRH